MDKLLSMLGLARRAGKIEPGFDAAVSAARGRKAAVLLCAQDMSEKTVKNLRYEGDRAGVLELLASADRLAGETARAAFLPADRIPAALAARISPARAEALHRLILDIRGRMQVNVSGSLLLAYLAGQMKGIMERPV